MEIGTHRPRNVGWTRAAALLYGDWGTSKAYVIGLAFVAAGFSSFPIILAVCLLTGLVGYNYIIICRHFPDGGGVYSAAREQSRVLAVLGSLLLLADFIVTASMSCWDAMSYFGVPKEYLKVATIGFILLIGFLNYFGPKHSGSFAVTLAIPMVLVVIAIIAFSAPHLTLTHLEPPHDSFGKNWVAFVGVILALSGVEAIANLTGVMKLDPDATPDAPRVAKTATRAIWPVAIEVVLGTALLGWAMLSLPQSYGMQIKERYADMLRFLGEEYGAMALGAHFGHVFGVVIGLVVGLLLLSAVNTAVSAMIGLMYMLARDQEMPKPFTKLNSHGVPWPPLMVAIVLPVFLVLISDDLDSLADMYAIGVVGAITVNLGSSCFNKRLKLNWREFSIMLVTFLVLFAVEVTIAKTKPAALFFAACVLGVGFGLRWYSMKRAGMETVMVPKEMAAAIKPEQVATLKPNLSPGQSILVAARGITPVLRFALEEAKLREGNLYVLYVKQLSVSLPAAIGKGNKPRWQDDRNAAAIMCGMFDLAKAQGVTVLPVYAVSDNPAATILDITATLGVDILMLGAPHRSALAKLLSGDVVTEVARNLPENIQLVIHS
ncbi:MAG TPA: amino acid permease [Candidatus Paceibacterota bacterium]|nr:amino acid permease [Candidatus Paceibacterota bacterium]